MKIHQIQEAIHKWLLKARSLERLVESRRFEELWDAATEPQRTDLETILKSLTDSSSIESFHKWSERRRVTLLGERTYAELRLMARNSQIPRYSRLSKGELLSELSRLEKS